MGLRWALRDSNRWIPLSPQVTGLLAFGQCYF